MGVRFRLSNRMATERTFIAIKPDGVQRGLVGEIIKRFEQRGYKLVAMKLCRPGKEHLEKHYADLSSKGFFAGLIQYMNSGPICAMVWEGKNVVKMGRMMLGETNPQASLPGSIRGDFSIEVGRNICHGSDAVESANAEIAVDQTIHHQFSSLEHQEQSVQKHHGPPLTVILFASLVQLEQYFVPELFDHAALF